MNTSIYLVRHAHSIYTPDELRRPLSEKGYRDAEGITKILSIENINVVLASPYKRAIQTVEGMAKHIGTEIIIDVGLKVVQMNDIGKRIMIIGSPGSGKSTFSRKLSQITDRPLIHLDKEFWNDGWVETPRKEWIEKQRVLISGDEWIVDGNYGGTMDIRLEKADTIICFNLNRAVCLMSYFKRVITNINKIRPDMPEGCPEKFDFEFMKYIWNFKWTSGQKNIDIIEKSKGKQIIVFKHRREAKMYIKKFLM